MFRLFWLKSYLLIVYIGYTFKIIPSHHFSVKLKIYWDFLVKLLVNLVMISRFSYVSKINRLPYLINWRPPVHKENFQEQDNNFPFYFWAFIWQTSMFNVQLLVILERERAVYVKITCLMYYHDGVPCLFFSGLFHLYKMMYYAEQLSFWCLCGLQFSRVNPFIFKISNFSPNNSRKTQIFIVVSFRLHSRSIWIIWERMKNTQIRNTTCFSVDSLCCVNTLPEKNVFARQ